MLCGGIVCGSVPGRVADGCEGLGSVRAGLVDICMWGTRWDRTKDRTGMISHKAIMRLQRNAANDFTKIRDNTMIWILER